METRKSLTLLLATTVACFVASPTRAALFLNSSPGPQLASASTALMTIDFNGASVFGLSGNYSLVTGSLTNRYAQPFGTTSQYLELPAQGVKGSATLDLSSYDLAGATGFNFYWGSIDSFNIVQIDTSAGRTQFAFDGVLAPLMAAGANRQASDTNRRVYFTLVPGEDLRSLTFISNGIAFEIDDLVITRDVDTVVPEPAAWAMMLAGFGLVGGALRSRNRRPAALAD